VTCCKCEEYKWNDPQPVVYEDPTVSKGYCLFHAPVEHKGVSVSEFNEQVSERIQAVIDLEDKVAHCNLSGTIFPGPIRFAKESPLPVIIFYKTRFTGEVSFLANSFESQSFFHEATFDAMAQFYRATFNASVTFSGAIFNGSAIFKEATFKDSAQFDNAVFNSKTSFQKASFGGVAGFNYAVFTMGSSFSSTTFNEVTSFRETQFKKKNYYIAVQCNAMLSFSSIKTDNETEIGFANCLVSHSSITFTKCDPNRCDFTLQRDLRNIHFIDSPWEKNGLIKAYPEDKAGELQVTRDFYQRMKAKYKGENNEYEASKWHVAEKEVQRKLLKENNESKGLRSALFLYRWSSQYGEDPVLAGKWLLGAIVALWLLLGLGGIHDGQTVIQGPASSITWESISNFGIVFITLFKNIMLFKTVEFKSLYGMIDGVILVMTRLLIPLQAALFAFALRNRFRR